MNSTTDVSNFGFSPESTGTVNTLALQAAADRGGPIIVTRPGKYRIAGTVYLGSHTSLQFSPGVILQKVNETGPFSHVFLNKGALTRTFDEQILVEGLTLEVNGIDSLDWQVFGLRGQIAFFHVRDLCIRRFRCRDLGSMQFAIHVCSFEDILIEDLFIKGDKDGVHLGRGKRFTIRDGVFQTFDDAIALNAHDYDTSNPELGWIESGVVENCHDLFAEETSGHFARIVGGAWTDWYAGMEVQKSDTVVSAGRIYRVKAEPDGISHRSITQPLHESGTQVLDGISWVMVQMGSFYTAGVRDVVFRDIFLQKPRIGFTVRFENDRFSRSYYPGAPRPLQQRLLLENVRKLHGDMHELVSISTPIDTVSLCNCVLGSRTIDFHNAGGLLEHGPTHINLVGCVFPLPGDSLVLENSIPGKEVHLHTSGSLALHENFRAQVQDGPMRATVRSDLPGLE